jgi:hypothetical protein
MAMETRCQTPGATYKSRITEYGVTVAVRYGKKLDLTEQEAELLEQNIHNALELVLAPYYRD